LPKEFVEKAGYDRAERLERFNRLAESEITVEQGAKELTRRRRDQEGEPPLVEVKVKADGPLILKQATDDVQYSRGLALRERLLNSGHTEDEVVSVGHQMLAGNDPLNPPPTEVGLVDREGKEFKKLGDRVRVGQELSVHKATELVQNWRQQQAEQQRELLATLQAGEQMLAEKAAEAAQPEVLAQQPIIYEQANEAVEQERAQLQAERQAIAEAGRLSGAEIAVKAKLGEWRDWAQKNAPSIDAVLKNPSANPRAFAELQKAEATVRQLVTADGQLRQQREFREPRSRSMRSRDISKRVKLMPKSKIANSGSRLRKRCADMIGVNYKEAPANY
jgi:hypothetical protein